MEDNIKARRASNGFKELPTTRIWHASIRRVATDYRVTTLFMYAPPYYDDGDSVERDCWSVNNGWVVDKVKCGGLFKGSGIRSRSVSAGLLLESV